YYEKSSAHLTDYGVANGIADPSRVYSPAFIYNFLKQGVIPEECRTGIAYSSAFNFIKANGAVTWKDLPYLQDIESCKANIPDSVWRHSQSHNGYYFEKINNTVDDIKLYVSLGIPVIIGIFTSANLYNQGLGIQPGHVLLWSPAASDRKEYH